MADTLIQEVNDALRQDKMHRLWQRVRMPLFLVMGALIAATAGTSIYKHNTQKRQETVSAALISAIHAYGQKQYALAETKLHDARAQAKPGTELAALTQFWQARNLLAKGDSTQAIAEFTALTHESTALRVRDMACIHLYSLNADIPAHCQGEGPSPLQPSLKLLHASQLWQQGDAAQAQALLAQLKQNAAGDQELQRLAEHYLTTLQAAQSDQPAQ